MIDGNRIVAVGNGAAPPCDERVEGRGRLVTPGLVNTHHHLYQWLTRGYATDHTLFEWLTTLYPIWARMDEDLVEAAAAANLAWLRCPDAVRAPTTTTSSRGTAATCSPPRSALRSRSGCASTRHVAR